MSDHKKITVEDFNRELSEPKPKKIIDVRSQDEYKSGTIPGAICIPHSELAEKAHELNKEDELYVFCGSGKRSAIACENLKELGFKKIKELEGGYTSWTGSGLEVKKSRKAISIQRQVLIAAGSLITIGMLLGYFYNNGFYALSAFVGVGLLFAGLSGYCGMALLLEIMPWNKIQK